jgi:hypothetical protein
LPDLTQWSGAMKRAERLTTVAGAENFVLTLWADAQTAEGRAAGNMPAVYLPMDPERARTLVGSLDRWLAALERQN